MSILDEFEKEFSEISIEQTMLHGFDSYADAISDVRHFLKDAYKKAVLKEKIALLKDISANSKFDENYSVNVINMIDRLRAELKEIEK